MHHLPDAAAPHAAPPHAARPHPRTSSPGPLPGGLLPEHAGPVSDLIERVLRQRPTARVEIVIRLVRATLGHPAWERLPAEEAARRAERLVLAQLARLPAPREGDAQDACARSVDVTDTRRARHPAGREVTSSVPRSGPR